MGIEDETTQRLDKWLWYARMAKTRSLAQALIEDGAVRLNRERIAKPSQLVRIGDLVSVLTGARLRLLQVAALGQRRGPFAEAQALFADLSPPSAPPGGDQAPPPAAGRDRDPGSGRPTKRDRRLTDRLKGA